MRHTTFSFFCSKVFLFVASIALLLWPFAAAIHDFKRKYEPRTALFNEVDMGEYSFALLGDSAFCSYYVNNDNDSIWKKFESFTGEKCFSGAVEGSRNVDLINGAKYLSHKMSPHSTVFIDILPNRVIAYDRSQQGHYEHQFTDVRRREESMIYNSLSYLNLNYLSYLKRIGRGVHTDRYELTQHNRTWNVDGGHAKEHYRDFINWYNGGVSKEGEPFLNELASTLREAKINVIFVLAPFNKTLLYAYSDKSQAEKIFFKIKKNIEKIKIYLNEINASYIDLAEVVPASCFADLLHVNACGDEIIARSLADYVKSGKIKR